MSNKQHTPEPFGFFKAEPFGWTDCAETDEGAQPLFDQAAIDAIARQRDELLADLTAARNALLREGMQRDELLAALGSQAANDVIAERHRQQAVEGWTPEHDDEHETGELATAAACYAGNAGGYVWQGGWPGEVWPWAREWWKPSTPRRDLVKAAALILAEIERIDRAAITSVKGTPK